MKSITLKPSLFRNQIVLGPDWISNGSFAIRRPYVKNAGLLLSEASARTAFPNCHNAREWTAEKEREVMTQMSGPTRPFTFTASPLMIGEQVERRLFYCAETKTWTSVDRTYLALFDLDYKGAELHSAHGDEKGALWDTKTFDESTLVISPFTVKLETLADTINALAEALDTLNGVSA